MDVNAISVFPTRFLENVMAEPTLAVYFHGIHQRSYTHMMSSILNILLDDGPIAHDVILHLHEKHSQMKLTRTDYYKFLSIFEKTLRDDLCVRDIDATHVMNRLKKVVLLLQAHKKDRCEEMLNVLVRHIKESSDLNTAREQLLEDVHDLEDHMKHSMHMFFTHSNDDSNIR